MGSSGSSQRRPWKSQLPAALLKSCLRLQQNALNMFQTVQMAIIAMMGIGAEFSWNIDLCKQRLLLNMIPLNTSRSGTPTLKSASGR